jgi:hypothetical protein
VTIWRTDAFQEVTKRLQLLDEHYFHFCRVASEETILSRLFKRDSSSNDWAKQRVGICVKAFESSLFDEKITTEKLSYSQVAELIAEKVT